MKRIAFAILLTTLLSIHLMSSQDAHAELVLTTPDIEYRVDVTADSGYYDGTASSVWVRLYSADAAAWSDWQLFVGIDPGETRELFFTTASGFTDITDIEVWIGDDGARISLGLDAPDNRTYTVGPYSEWVKNGATLFNPSVVQFFECEDDDTDSVVCSCDVGQDCWNMLVSGVCDADSWECDEDYCTCFPG